jgi:hypothetical protein
MQIKLVPPPRAYQTTTATTTPLDLLGAALGAGGAVKRDVIIDAEADFEVVKSDAAANKDSATDAATTQQFGEVVHRKAHIQPGMMVQRGRCPCEL